MPTAPEKLLILHAIRADVAAGLSVPEACARRGTTRGTFHRWDKAEREHGLAGLADGSGALRGGKQSRKPEEGQRRTGRPASVALTAGEVEALRGLALICQGTDPAVERWLEEAERAAAGRPRLHGDYALPEAGTLVRLRGIVAAARQQRRRISWPIDIVRACRSGQTAANKGMMRGGLEALAVQPSARRGMWWEDEDGASVPMLAGSIYGSDDMSGNQPFRYVDTDGTERLGRQGLYTGDVYSAALLGCSLIGRPRDSYRVEDIADHLRGVVQTYGLPLIWRFERGVWDNNFIYGVKPPPSWHELDAERWGGLGVLFRIAQKHTPRGKGELERSFRSFQALMRHRFTDVGNYRGEFDSVKKLYVRALRGDKNALRKFWTMQEHLTASAEVMAIYHDRPQQRRAFGERVTPAELWAGYKGRACPAAEAWRFQPQKGFLTVRQGCVEMRAANYPQSFRFLVAGRLPDLDHGHRVFYAFHPGRPEEGCVLLNAEVTESPRNPARFRLAEVLGVAAYWADTPQESFAGMKTGFERKAEATAAVRGEFLAAMPGGAGQVVRTSTARDGLGAALHAERGGTGERGARGGAETQRGEEGMPAVSPRRERERSARAAEDDLLAAMRGRAAAEAAAELV